MDDRVSISSDQCNSSSADFDDSVSAEAFRRVAGTFATGVTVITAEVGGEPYGCAANAVTSLSLDPPTMLVCLSRASKTHRHVLAASGFAINTLPDSAEGRALCRAFAGKAGDKFKDVSYRAGRTGAPLLHQAMSWLDCVLEQTHDSGDHTIFIGRVIDADESVDTPLLFYRGQFATMVEPRSRPRRNVTVVSDGVDLSHGI